MVAISFSNKSLLYKIIFLCSLSCYQNLDYNKLRTTLLQYERNHKELLQAIKNAWCRKGVSIISDKWSDRRRISLNNPIFVTENGPMYVKAINCSNEIKKTMISLPNI